MSLQQQRAALAAPDVPHDDAVVGGPREQQPLDGVPPQGCYATCTERSTPVTWGGERRDHPSLAPPGGSEKSCRMRKDYTSSSQVKRSCWSDNKALKVTSGVMNSSSRQVLQMKGESDLSIRFV